MWGALTSPGNLSQVQTWAPLQTCEVRETLGVSQDPRAPSGAPDAGTEFENHWYNIQYIVYPHYAVGHVSRQRFHVHIVNLYLIIGDTSFLWLYNLICYILIFIIIFIHYYMLVIIP